MRKIIHVLRLLHLLLWQVSSLPLVPPGKPIPQHNKGHICQAHSVIIRKIQIKTSMKYHLRYVRMAVIKKKITSVGIMWGKGNLYTLLVGI